MDHQRYLEWQRARLAQLLDDLTCVNLAVQTREAMYTRGDLQRRIKEQREAIAIVEGAIAA